MKQKTFPPPHSLIKGYPYDEIYSKLKFKKHRRPATNELAIFAEEGSPRILSLIQEQEEALEIAEQQIKDILEEHPFSPENFGFMLEGEPGKIQQQIFISKYNRKIFLYRKPGSNLWILNDTEKDQKLELDLVCARIAFAAFYALNIQVEEDEVELLEAPGLLPPIGKHPEAWVPRKDWRDKYFCGVDPID